MAGVAWGAGYVVPRHAMDATLCHAMSFDRLYPVFQDYFGRVAKNHRKTIEFCNDKAINGISNLTIGGHPAYTPWGTLALVGRGVDGPVFFSVTKYISDGAAGVRRANNPSC